jgi:hypothetical protein
MAATLSILDVARIFDRDLKEKSADVRFNLSRIEDPGLIAAVNAVYPEAVPVGKAPRSSTRAEVRGEESMLARREGFETPIPRFEA